jgi:hypothetical protein
MSPVALSETLIADPHRLGAVVGKSVTPGGRVSITGYGRFYLLALSWIRSLRESEFGEKQDRTRKNNESQHRCPVSANRFPPRTRRFSRG